MTHTHSKIQLHYFWPGMSDFIRDRITACHKCIARKSPVNRHQPMGHVPVSGRFERVAMDLLDVSVISAKGHKYIIVDIHFHDAITDRAVILSQIGSALKHHNHSVAVLTKFILI